MPHNFKLTGNYYVSVDGSDSNDGLTKDTPKRTIQAAINLVPSGSAGTYNFIIGSGFYDENIFRSQNSSSTITILNFIADGIVIISNNTKAKSLLFSLGVGFGNTTYSLSFVNIMFMNVLYTHTVISDYSESKSTFTGCTFIDTSFSGTLSTFQNQIQGYIFISCKLLSCLIGYNVSGGILALSSFTSCILINSIFTTALSAVTRFTNSYSQYPIPCRSTITAANFNFNNIQGPIIMNVATAVTTGTYQDIYGRYYDLTLAGNGGSGTIETPYYRADTLGKAFSYTNHRILYPTMNVNSISVDPQFNNIQAQDFTLQATSPMIGRASDGINNIGGTKYAIRHAANGSVFLADAISITDLNFINNDYVVTSPATNGQVIGAPIQLGTSLKVVQKISYNGLLQFNKASGAGPVSGNRNVPDNYVFGTGTQGANPDRLVYELRYSTQVTEPAIDAEWDNGGYITAGNYFTMEWDTKPSFDTAFIGNGGATFNNADTPTYLNATWIQLKIVLRNNYI
jgi:hypothetical protein